MRILILTGVFILAVNTAFACGGGGGTASSNGTIKSWALGLASKVMTSSKDVVKALSLAKKYQEQAIREGDTAESHQKAAY